MSYIGIKEIYTIGCFIYSEYSYTYFSTRMNILKFSTLNFIYIKVNQQSINLKSCRLHQLQNKLNNNKSMCLGLLRMFFYYLINGSINTYKLKLQLVGLGYRFFFKKNFVSMKVGFSHVINFLLLFFFSLKKKKKHYDYNFKFL